MCEPAWVRVLEYSRMEIDRGGGVARVLRCRLKFYYKVLLVLL